MSNREKILGFATGGLLGIFLLYGIYSMVTGRLQDKQDEIVRLDATLRKEKIQQKEGTAKQNLLYQYYKRSLDAELHKANLEFIHWLQNQVKAVGLRQETVRFQGVPPHRTRPYTELTYNVSGTGDIKQLTKLLYNIHSAENLNRVRSLNIRKQKDTKQLKLDFVVDALSIDIDGQKLATQLGGKLSPEELVAMTTKVPVGITNPAKLAYSLKEYESRITQRNSFSPANLPPTLTSSKRQKVEIGKRLSVNLEAKDPEDDEVTFEIDQAAPAAVEISKSGRLTWRPKELGDYEFYVYLVDNGIPSKETKETITVSVVPEVKAEEPEREDPFDAAKLAVMTAIVQGPKSPKPLMCMYLRSEDEYQYLAAGDDIEIGNWSGVVTQVDPDRSQARIQTDDGDYVLLLGQALADAKFVKADADEEKGKRL